MRSLVTDEKMTEVAGLESALRESEAQRDMSSRGYAALSMTASHVFRKAEKIASKQKHPAEITVLLRVTEILSDHEIPDCTDLHNTLSTACPIAERMIVAGEIQLKNKEERAVFSDTKQFTTEICRSCRDLMTRKETHRIAREKLASHPLKVRSEALGREKNQLETMLHKEQLLRQELKEWRDKTLEKNPALRTALQENVEKLAGRTVRVQVKELHPGE